MGGVSMAPVASASGGGGGSAKPAGDNRATGGGGKRRRCRRKWRQRKRQRWRIGINGEPHRRKKINSAARPSGELVRRAEWWSVVAAEDSFVLGARGGGQQTKANRRHFSWREYVPCSL